MNPQKNSLNPNTDADPTSSISFHQRFSYTIVHEEVSNIKESGMPGMYTKTWNVLAEPFIWEIIRPKAGAQTFERVCPYCGQSLKISMSSVDFQFASRKAGQKQGKSLLVFGAVALVICVALIIIFAQVTVDSWQGSVWNFSVFGAIISFFVCFIGLVMVFANISPNVDGYRVGGELKYGRLNTPSCQHYVKSRICL